MTMHKNDDFVKRARRFYDGYPLERMPVTTQTVREYTPTLPASEAGLAFATDAWRTQVNYQRIRTGFEPIVAHAVAELVEPPIAA